jgi:beta-glucosidase
MAIQKEYGSKLKIFAEKGLTYSRDNNPAGIAKAVAIARKADVILYFAGEEAILSGEAHCRADISLPGAQSELLNQLKKLGKPIVTIFMAGRPLTIEKELDQSDAVIYAFHGGTMAGSALADLIFGKAVPSGKLTVTFPRMVGQIPVYYSHRNSGRPGHNIVLINDIKIGAEQTSLGNTSYHLDAGDKPLFPFGFGMSYTTFSYSTVKLSKNKIFENETVTAECTITNTGKVTGMEVAQLYICDPIATLAQPVRELKGFQKIALNPGQSKTVKFSLSGKQLGFWHQDNTYKAESGEFRVWISADSQTGEYKSFNFTN